MLINKVAARAASDVVVMIIFGATALLLYGRVSGYQVSSLSAFDIRAAFLLASGFCLLSGFIVSIIAVNAVRSLRASFVRRAIVMGLLFVVHSVVFYYVAGTSYSSSDIALVMIGLAAVVLSEAANGRLWQGKSSNVN